MDLISSSLYGIIQGVTEFLPVSSSGHLAILPHFLNIKDPGVVFDLSMHVGTALSVMLYFKKDVLAILREAFDILKFKKSDSKERYYTLNLMCSTLATFILAIILKKFATEFGRTPLLIAFNLFIFGLFMFIADYLSKGQENKTMDKPQWKAAIAIGLFQALAIFPGVSRSGATLTISRFMHLTREEATRYSFLLSLPIIWAGFIMHLPDMFKDNASFDVLSCLFGVTTSFLVGIATIHFFLKVIKKIGLGAFSVYRFLLAAIIMFKVL